MSERWNPVGKCRNCGAVVTITTARLATEHFGIARREGVTETHDCYWEHQKGHLGVYDVIAFVPAEDDHE